MMDWSAVALSVPRPSQAVGANVFCVVGTPTPGHPAWAPGPVRHNVEGPLARRRTARHDKRRAVAAHDEVLLIVEVGRRSGRAAGSLFVRVRRRLVRQTSPAECTGLLFRRSRLVVRVGRRECDRRGERLPAARPGRRSIVLVVSSTTDDVAARLPSSSKADNRQQVKRETARIPDEFRLQPFREPLRPRLSVYSSSRSSKGVELLVTWTMAPTSSQRGEDLLKKAGGPLDIRSSAWTVPPP